MSEKRNLLTDGLTRLHDAQLEILCNSWADLPEFEWNAGPLIINAETRASEKWECEPKLTRHISNHPATDLWFVRFVFRKTRVYFAKAKFDRLDDLCRYADVLTLKLLPYRERQRHVVRETLFNFSSIDAAQDLETWTFSRPDIIELINAQIARLEELEIICLPENRKADKETVHSKSRTRSVSGKVASLLAYQSDDINQLLADKLLAFQTLYASSIKEIHTLNSRLDSIDKVLADFTPARRTDVPAAPHNVCATPGECAGKPEFAGPQFN